MGPFVLIEIISQKAYRIGNQKNRFKTILRELCSGCPNPDKKGETAEIYRKTGLLAL